MDADDEVAKILLALFEDRFIETPQSPVLKSVSLCLKLKGELLLITQPASQMYKELPLGPTRSSVVFVAISYTTVFSVAYHVRQVRQRIDEQIVELLIPQIMGEIDAVKLVPQQAIDKQIVEPHSTDYGGQCRRVQKCTPGAIFGTDL